MFVCGCFFMELIEMKSDSSLLTGSVPKKLAAFALPLFLGNLLQALYNAVDMLVVGRIVGETGLAAISNASMLGYIINSLGLGLTMGGAVLAAQFKGAGDAQGQRDCVSMLLFASLSASVLVTFAGLAACEPVFRALYVPADAYDDACEYMKAICWGTVFVFGYNAVCSALKGLGDSVTPLYIVAAAAVINIALDILFVGPLAHGARPARPLPGSGHFPRPPSLSGHDLFQKPRLGAKKASFTHRRIL